MLNAKCHLRIRSFQLAQVLSERSLWALEAFLARHGCPHAALYIHNRDANLHDGDARHDSAAVCGDSSTIGVDTHGTDSESAPRMQSAP
jgi:hypothetical protein